VNWSPAFEVLSKGALVAQVFLGFVRIREVGSLLVSGLVCVHRQSCDSRIVTRDMKTGLAATMDMDKLTATLYCLIGVGGKFMWVGISVAHVTF
jgi:hypothetical protein